LDVRWLYQAGLGERGEGAHFTVTGQMPAVLPAGYARAISVA
jgi:hypothetical protein